MLAKMQGEKGTFIHCWWEQKLELPFKKLKSELHQKAKNRTRYGGLIL
jgi:hypothetical protein